MTRQEAIEIIENTFPVDSPYSATAKTGKKLLERAICETWRTELSDEVLLAYAWKCLQTSEGL